MTTQLLFTKIIYIKPAIRIFVFFLIVASTILIRHTTKAFLSASFLSISF